MKQNNIKKHSCQAVIITCMDYRLDKNLEKWIHKEMRNKLFDRLALAGASKNLPFVINQIGLSKKLHHICEVYLIHHENCGAYGKEGNFAKHKKDMNLSRKTIQEKFPDLKVHMLYQKLNGEFVKVE